MNMDAYYDGQVARVIGAKRSEYPRSIGKSGIRDWKSGWDTEDSRIEREKEQEKWDSISSGCPWVYTGPNSEEKKCRVTESFCRKDRCAPLYFIETVNID